MHELAITESIVTGVCERVGDCRVTKVVLEVGRFSGAAADAIRFCFDVSAKGTALEGAALEIFEPAARARCRECGLDFEPPDSLALCGCGSADVELIAGLALKIRSVEVA
jgi:hydrogenase nickel incorporation protein HypA/HybF